MKVKVEQFESGWQGLILGLTSKEIDELIAALKQLKIDRGHFHFRSDFEGFPSIGDIEFYWQSSDASSDLVLEASNVINPR
ncbi:hypothetical protein [Marinimicrobium alkaliphilum]|uniref:hypothetical protein n=1 Tax=Marinimicrobium alkaliphilum TaxID=2202654 RepID=UPI000DB9174C|nr:hypothetical protein [Marinimicrobium alkaliphilum]